jgi:BlaI family transcriptional regulator, penicillinase repressor
MTFPPPLHELEAEVMDEVWSGDGRTVREVLEAINARSSPQRAYTTILTVMQRLHAKELLGRERDGRHDVYVAAMTREEYAQARAETEVRALVDEYGDVALAQFARRMSQLDAKRREQIRRLAQRD